MGHRECGMGTRSLTEINGLSEPMSSRFWTTWRACVESVNVYVELNRLKRTRDKITESPT
jgi:hypothetical protein